MTDRRFTPAQIAWHWLSVALLAALLASGFLYSYDVLGGGAIVFHQITAQLLIVTVVLRLIWRLRRPPAADTAHQAWERALAGLVHLALYLSLLAFIVTGYVAASSLREPSLLWPLDRGWARSDTGEWLTEIHYILPWIFLGILALHVAGALKHALIDRDGTLRAMWFSKARS